MAAMSCIQLKLLTLSKKIPSKPSRNPLPKLIMLVNGEITNLLNDFENCGVIVVKYAHAIQIYIPYINVTTRHTLVSSPGSKPLESLIYIFI